MNGLERAMRDARMGDTAARSHAVGLLLRRGAGRSLAENQFLIEMALAGNERAIVAMWPQLVELAKAGDEGAIPIVLPRLIRAGNFPMREHHRFMMIALEGNVSAAAALLPLARRTDSEWMYELLDLLDR